MRNYFKILWDGRLIRPGYWFAFNLYKGNFYWFWYFTLTPHKNNKTWFHCYIHTPLFHYSQNNCLKSFGLSFGKWQIGFTYHY